MSDFQPNLRHLSMNQNTFASGSGLRHLLLLTFIVIIATTLVCSGPLAVAFRVGAVTPPRLIVVLVLDGLRSDSINARDTPVLNRLRTEGVEYRNTHSVFPTVTRVNAAALATGTYPTRNGLVSNSMYVPGVDPVKPFTTADYQPLLKMKELSGGRLLFSKTLGERLQENGKQLVVVSSGSTGLSLLLNPKAPEGVGATINGYFESGKVAGYPSAVSNAVLSRFGPAPSQDSPHQNLNAAVDWAEIVLRDYVLAELKPDVLIDWLSEPDDTQHPKGVGSPEALGALRNCDRNLGLLLNKLESLGLAAKTDLIVISDHGFAQHTKGVNVKQHLIDAGLKHDADSDDVVVVSNAQSILLHVKNHDRNRIKQIVEYLQRQDWTDVIFTPAQGPLTTSDGTNYRKTSRVKQSSPYGWVPGTFSLELIRLANVERGPDIVFTLPWTSNLSPWGVAGTSYANSSGKGDEITGDAYGHGGLNPAAVHSTMIFWGVDFKQGGTRSEPSSNVDVAPTILNLLGISGGSDMDGRVLVEGMRGLNKSNTQVHTGTLTVRAINGYRAAIEISQLEKYRYVNLAQKISAGK